MSPRRREGPYWNAERGTFYFDAYVGFPPHEKRIRKSLRTADPKRAKWLWDQEYKKEWGKYYGIANGPPSRPATLEDLVPLYISYERDAAKVKSWDTFRRRLDHVMAALGPERSLSDIGPAEIRILEAYLAKLARPRSRATVNHYVGLIKAFYNWAIREGHFSQENPMKRIKAYPVDRKRREYSDEEIRKILAAAAELEARDPGPFPVLRYSRRLVLLLLLTGMRSGEVLALRWASVKEDRIVLERSETKQGREKIIPLTAGVLRILEELRSDADGSGLVFPLPPAQRWQARYVITGIREIAKMPGFVLHGLRHTAASIMVSEALGRGAGMDDVMRVLGHSKIETTLRYDHSAMSRMRKAMEALESKVGK